MSTLSPRGLQKSATCKPPSGSPLFRCTVFFDARRIRFNTAFPDAREDFDEFAKPRVRGGIGDPPLVIWPRDRQFGVRGALQNRGLFPLHATAN